MNVTSTIVLRLFTLTSYFLVVFLTVMGTTDVHGQTAATAGLTGRVTDPSGASVPNVKVTVENSDTAQVRTALTDVSGVYALTLLPPGTYRVSFSADGFKTAEVMGLRISVTETPVLNRVLELGVQNEQVTVEVSVEGLQTASSTLGTVVGERAVSALPLTTRNYTQIIGLSAGVNASVNNASAVGNGSQDVSVNGMNTNHNNYQMDGVSITPIGGGGTISAGTYAGIGIPSPDALAEFKIQTSQYDAGYGRNPGANVNVITKSGTNVWHGTMFEFFRNTVLNANGFFENRNGAGKAPLDQNQFGGVLGGPIEKDKLFIFGSFQGTRQKNGVDPSGRSNVTLAPIPLGDRSASGFRSALGAAFCIEPTFTQKIGLGGAQVGCDGSNINPVALNILRLKNANGSYYIPSSPTGTYSAATFIDPTIYNEEQYLANADYLINAKHTAAARVFYSTQHTLRGFSCFGPCLPGARERDLFKNTYLVLKLRSSMRRGFHSIAILPTRIRR